MTKLNTDISKSESAKIEEPNFDSNRESGNSVDFESDQDISVNDDLAHQFMPLLHHGDTIQVSHKNSRCNKNSKLLMVFSFITLLCLVFTSLLWINNGCMIFCEEANIKRPGCTNISKTVVWTHGIPKLITESAFRLVDVNQDGILDIIFGFATGKFFSHMKRKKNLLWK